VGTANAAVVRQNETHTLKQEVGPMELSKPSEADNSKEKSQTTLSSFEKPLPYLSFRNESFSRVISLFVALGLALCFHVWA